MASYPYNSARWQRVRARQLRREALCLACMSEGRLEPARDVDHITPIAAGGAVWDPSNLQSLCTPHHSIKTGAFDRVGKDWREYETRGCDEHGVPRDPSHPWNQDAKPH
jgi:5-methylcytosine-specific restriction enzyme A